MNNIFTSDKKLGFGLMRLPVLDSTDASTIDVELTKKMVDAFLENGFTYFDTAWMYCGFKSGARKDVAGGYFIADTTTTGRKASGNSKAKEIKDEQISFLGRKGLKYRWKIRNK